MGNTTGRTAEVEALAPGTAALAVPKAELGYLLTPDPEAVDVDVEAIDGLEFDVEDVGWDGEGRLIPHGVPEDGPAFFGSPRTARRRGPGAVDVAREETEGGGGPAALESIGSGKRVSSRFVNSTLRRTH